VRVPGTKETSTEDRRRGGTGGRPNPGWLGVDKSGKEGLKTGVQPPVAGPGEGGQ